VLLIRVCVGLVVSSIAVAPPASAQSSEPESPAPRVFRGLFGPAERDERRPPAVTLTLSLYGASDSNSRFATSSEASDETLQAQRVYEGAHAGLAIVRRRPHSTLRIDGASAIRYYSDLHRIATQKHGGSVAFESMLSTRSKIQFAQTASFSPFYQLVLGRATSGAFDAPDLSAASSDFSVSRLKQIVYGSSAGMSYSPGRGELTLGFNRQYTDFFEGRDFHSERAAARYTYQLWPGIGLRLGYGFGSGGISGLETSRNHDLDIGLDYGRAIAFSPRTSLGFGSGTTIVSTVGGRQVQLTGSARLRHQFSRSTRWTAELAYDRGLQAVANVRRPFLASTLSAGINGYITRRISLRILPSYASGVDVGDESLSYQSVLAQGRIDVALSRNWAAYVEHFYYRYRFPPRTDLPAELAAGLDRQGLRVGLSLWAPAKR
jgi:hypothetical protein